MTRVLVLGATGMLGHVVVHELQESFDVHATVRDPERVTDLASDATTIHPFTAGADGDGLDELVAAAAPDAVVNCVGLVKQLPIASDPIAAIAINGLLPHRIARAADRSGARLVHVSTDCVFTGRLPIPGRYREHDPADAEDLYGRSKLLGEVHAAPHVTLRTSIIGPEREGATGLLEWFRAQRGPTVNGFTRAIWSGLTTAALARVIGEVIADHPELTGVYQVAAEPITKFELLQRLNDVLGTGHEIRAVDEPVVNRALDGSRFVEATSIEIPSWDAMIGEIARDLVA
jgi:dTDP-4-dehydrorhamnose reductase